jgi:hypothetical protein
MMLCAATPICGVLSRDDLYMCWLGAVEVDLCCNGKASKGWLLARFLLAAIQLDGMWGIFLRVGKNPQVEMRWGVFASSAVDRVSDAPWRD